jgi:hypothetical protein
VSTTLPNVQQIGGLTIQSCPQSQTTYPQSASALASTTSQILVPSEYCNGNTRVIGAAFEVVNTTAEISKQGQVTVYRLPTIKTPTMVSSTPIAGAFQTSYMNLQRFPPANLAQAQLLFGSRSWSAAEGAYVVARINDIDNPLLQPSFIPTGWLAQDVIANQGGTYFSSSAVTANYGQSDIQTPYDISGAYFTGLSFATSLTVNVRWLIERMPGPSETDLVVLATPSAPYDGLALELYTKALRDMPPGVMLKENPLGEWFRSALSAVADWAPKIGNALGTVLPGAGMIGNALGGGARVITSFLPNNAPATGRYENYTPPPLVGSASNATPRRRQMTVRVASRPRTIVQKKPKKKNRAATAR